jgi:hypothetical protein
MARSHGAAWRHDELREAIEAMNPMIAALKIKHDERNTIIPSGIIVYEPFKYLLTKPN